jgi:hypothetical protein
MEQKEYDRIKRWDKDLERLGAGNKGHLNYLNYFKRHIKYPSFKRVQEGKSPYDDLQLSLINNLLNKSTEIAQMTTNFKEVIKYLNSEGFDKFNWDTFKSYAIYNFNNDSVKNKIKEVEKEKKAKFNEEKKEFIVKTSSLITDEFIVEQCYNKKTNFTYFAKFDKKTEEIEIVRTFTHDGIVYEPIYGEELPKQAVILPKEPVEYGTDEDLDKELFDHIYGWLDIPEDYLRLVIYNIKLSWVYQRFNTLNYTRALGDTGTGKSRFLFTLGHIHYKPMLVAGTLTPAVIFRLINKWGGTLLIDEGDQESSDENNAFIKIMNCGYERGTPVSRCDKNDPNKIDFFEVFCPKVLTTRRRFTDKATEARCMTSIMRQTARNDIYDTFVERYFDKAEELRGKLLMWRFRNYNTIDPEAGHKVDLSAFEPRLRQVNRAFISLFSKDKDSMVRFMEHMNEYQQNIIEERAESFDGVIINAIASMMAQGWDVITPTDIITYLKESGEDFKYELYPRSLGKKLKTLGLTFKRKKVFGKTKNCLDTKMKILENLFSRYLVDEEVAKKLENLGYVVTSVTLVTSVTDGYAKKKKKETIEKKMMCSDVSDVTNVTNVSHVTSNIEVESIEEDQNEPESLDITPNDIVQHILYNGENEMNIEQLKEDLNIDDGVLNSMKSAGEIIEKRPGFVMVNK